MANEEQIEPAGDLQEAVLLGIAIEPVEVALRLDGTPSVPEVGVHPQPPQGERLPLWIGGQGDAAVRIAAEHGAGLFIWLQTPERVAEYGRALRALRPGAPLAACVWTSQEERLWAGQVRAMEKAGVDLMVIGRRYDDRQVNEIERFASEFL